MCYDRCSTARYAWQLGLECKRGARWSCLVFCFCQGEDGIRELVRSRGLGDVYKRQAHLATSVGEVRSAEQRGDLGLVDGRGVEEPGIVGRSPQRPRLAGDVVGGGVGRGGVGAPRPSLLHLSRCAAAGYGRSRGARGR